MAGIRGKDDGKTLLLLKPRGFCAGVVRAIDVVRIALEAFGPPIYVRKEIVHNSFVVEELRGSYSGVVGLPLFETARLLAEAGVPTWCSKAGAQE